MQDLVRMTVEGMGDVAVARRRDREPRDEEGTALRAEFRRLLALPACRHVAIDIRDVESFEANLRGVLVWVYMGSAGPRRPPGAPRVAARHAPAPHDPAVRVVHDGP